MILPKILSRTLSAVGRWLYQKSDPGGFAKFVTTSGRPVGIQDSYDSLAYNGYSNQAIGHHAVSKVARCFADVPLVLQELVGDEWSDVDDSEDHPLMQLLDSPNLMQSGADLKIGWASSYLTMGESFLLKTQSSVNVAPAELWQARADRMYVKPGAQGIPEFYELQANGTKKAFPVDPKTGRSQVVHTKTWNPRNDWRGCSPLRSAANQIDQHTWAAEWNKNALQNGGVPSGVFTAGKDDTGNPIMLADDQRQRLEDDINDRMMGTENSRKILIADGGLEFTPMSFTAEDLSWLEGSRDAARIIALAVGVPGQLLGIPGDNTYSNYEQAELCFYEQTILPMCRLWISMLTRCLIPLYGDTRKLRLIVDEDAISALAPRRAEVWEKVAGCQFMTTNEQREAVGMEPLDGDQYDQVIVPSMQTTLTALVAGPEEQSENDDADPDAPGSESPSAGQTSVAKPKGKAKTGKAGARRKAARARGRALVAKMRGRDASHGFDRALTINQQLRQALIEHARN